MPEAPKTEVNVMTNLGHEISKAMQDAGLVYDVKMQQKVLNFTSKFQIVFNFICIVYAFWE